MRRQYSNACLYLTALICAQYGAYLLFEFSCPSSAGKILPDAPMVSREGGGDKFELARSQSYGFFYDVTASDWTVLRKIYREHSNHLNPERPLMYNPNNVMKQGIETWGDPQLFSSYTAWYQSNYEPNFSCQFEKRVGVPMNGDGPKWICDPHRIKKLAADRKKKDGNHPGCVVYSIGSSGSFIFELGMQAELGEGVCEYHIFDPGNYKPPAELKRAYYHKWGLKAQDPNVVDPKPGQAYYGLRDTMKLLGHDKLDAIDVFKIDCERCEWETFNDWIADGMPLLHQIQVEVHEAPGQTAVDFFDTLEKAGYLRFHKEPNIQYNPSCIEYAFIRVDAAFMEGKKITATSFSTKQYEESLKPSAERELPRISNTSARTTVHEAPEPVQLAHDSDVLKNACISYDSGLKTHHISYRGVYGSWQGRTKDRNDPESFHFTSRKNYWLRTSYVQDEIKGAATTFPSQAMFIPAIDDQTHCVHDLLFSLLPMAVTGNLTRFEAIAVERSEKADYCTSVLMELGWFKTISLVPNNTCLDELWVPAFLYNRYPRGRSRGALRTRSEFMSTVDLPLRTIFYFQQQMQNAFLTGNNDLYTQKRRRILFDSRMGLGRDQWTNAKAAADLVEKRLDPQKYVVEVVNDIADLTLQQQAALYHSASVLVSPQYGSITNIVFMRPDAVVFELTCGESSWVRDWAFDLRIKHAVVRADDPPCKFPRHRTYAVQPTYVAELILDALT